MIRHLKFAFAAILLMAFPIVLAAQSPSSARSTVGEPAIAGGCSSIVADAANGGGSGLRRARRRR